MKNCKNESVKGFSLLELLVALAVVIILSSYAYMSLSSDKFYDADKQAFKIIDILHEARQYSLSRRNTMRVEINSTKKLIRLIDERSIGNAADDREIKSVAYIDNGVYVGTLPSNVRDSPTELSPVLPITFSTSIHPLSIGDTVATMRFLRNGTVTNAGSDAIGTGAVPTGVTIYIWSKYLNDSSTTPAIGQVFRAITVVATRGSTRMWKCSVEDGQCLEWINY
jgi:prepilin-type N-terminal cleavage/methylation domain-containing protein